MTNDTIMVKPWQAVEGQDKAQDGRFVFAVRDRRLLQAELRARRPKRENVEFFDAGASTKGGGYRASAVQAG